ncbi:MAG: metallophosphoesterase [Clostridiales bacterium]|nr:metallophosphoesterase [Eubacteriales bacterium]MDH7566018.1 metallophosphoesterase [Clostridiales bacterium]
MLILTGVIEMLKRFIIGLITVVLLFSVAGCSLAQYSKNNSSSSNTVQNNNQTTIQNSTTQAPDNSGNLSQKKSLRFVVMADSRGSDKGVNSTVVKKILQKIKQLSPQPQFAIMPGDLTDGSIDYSGINAQLSYFKQIVTQFYPVQFFYPGIGNHEMKAGENGEKAFAETFNEFKANFLEGYNRTTYYFDAGETRLFMLNSDHPGEMHKITGKQLDWLKSNIDPSKKYNIFLLHEPPYPTGAEAGNSLDKYPSLRDTFWKVVDNSNSPIVFCGHEHNYSRRLVDKSFNEKIEGTSFNFSKQIYQVITGGFGAPLYTQYTNKKNMVVPPIPQYHFTIVDVDDNGIKVQAVSVEGEIIDSF